MTTISGSDGIRAIALEQLQVSTTKSQSERRKHFDKAALEELADSIKKVGILSPIIARPVNGHFEIVAGERRLIAAKDAGLTAVSVDVRTLTDEEVIEIQLIENLQREGLHPLSEAEGYEALMKLGHTVEEVAEKLGKTRSYIYARTKLLALSADARKAFYAGKFPPSSALLLARIPMPVQLEALREITGPHYEDAPMSFREVKRLIHETYMLRLADAPFATGDATLVPKAGTCGACPKRTGNQPELFEDVKGKDLCTDPVCFKSKREASAQRKIDAAKEAGKKVITGAEAKKAISPYSDRSLNYNSGLAKLDEQCFDDPKHRTFKQLLGKEAETMLLQVPQSGDVIEVIDKAAALKQLKKEGVIKPREPAPRSSAPKPAKKDPLEEKLASALLAAICTKAPKVLPIDLLKIVVEHEMDVVGVLPEAVEEAFSDWHKHKAPDLYRLLFVLLTIGDYGSHEDVAYLTVEAKKLGIDPKKIRADLTAAAEAPSKPAKKTKGKKK